MTRSLESSYPDVGTRPKFNDYVQLQCNSVAELHVKTWERRDEDAVKAVIAKGVLPMTKEDRDAVIAVLDKYQIPPPVEVPPVIEEPIQ